MNQSTQMQRITALDYARAWAIFGMIIVNYKLAMQAESGGAAWLQAIAGIFEGRASALFVVLAGIGVSLMTAKVRSSVDRDALRQSRSGLFRRAVFLFAAGLLLLLFGWNADILHYYAVFMLIAAGLLAVADWLLVVLFSVVLILSQLFLVLFDYSKGWDSAFHEYMGFWTIGGFVRNLLFNGFHPVFPWVCFFLIGLWIGRKRWVSREYRLKLLLFGGVGTVVFETVSYTLIQGTSSVLDREAAFYLFSTKPMPPGVFYILSGICSALFMIAVSLYAVDKWQKSVLTEAIIHTGQLSYPIISVILLSD